MTATGWWCPDIVQTQRSRFHYVTESGRTLCGKWHYIGRGPVEEGMDEHEQNCAACMKKKRAQKERTS